MNAISPSLINLQGAAAAPAARSSTTNGTDVPSAGPSPAADSAVAMPGAASVMMSQVVSVLRASFTIAPTATPAAAALTPAENANQHFSSAVAQAVQSGDGSDASMDAVRSTVLQALGDVSQFLLGAGAAPADVSAASSALQSRLDALMSNVAPGGAVAGQATLVEKEKATLQIRTAEGDLVTLRIRARSSTTASLAAGAATDGTTAGAANMTTVNGARISVDVQGNISAAEAAAIGDVVKQVEALANQFFAGNVAQAFASAGSLQFDSTQLASVALSVRFGVSFSEVGVATAAPAAATSASNATGGSGASTPAAPATGTNGTAAAGAPPATPATTPATDPAAATPAAATTPSTDSPPSIMSILQDFLKQVLNFALSGSGDQSGTASVNLRLKLLLSVTEMLAPAATTPASPASTTTGAATGATATGTGTNTSASAGASTGTGAATGTGTGTGATSATPAAAPAAGPAAALTMLGSVFASFSSWLG